MRKALGGFTAVVLLALYAPIVVMVLFSFNESKYSVKWTGFTLDWYRKLAENTKLHQELWNTAKIALASTALSTVLGTMAALAARSTFRGKQLYTTLMALPVMVPDIVLAIALLAFFDAIALRRRTWARPRSRPSGRSRSRPFSRASSPGRCSPSLCPSTTSW